MHHRDTCANVVVEVPVHDVPGWNLSIMQAMAVPLWWCPPEDGSLWSGDGRHVRRILLCNWCYDSKLEEDTHHIPLDEFSIPWDEWLHQRCAGAPHTLSLCECAPTEVRAQSRSNPTPHLTQCVAQDIAVLRGIPPHVSIRALMSCWVAHRTMLNEMYLMEEDIRYHMDGHQQIVQILQHMAVPFYFCPTTHAVMCEELQDMERQLAKYDTCGRDVWDHFELWQRNAEQMMRESHHRVTVQVKTLQLELELCDSIVPDFEYNVLQGNLWQSNAQRMLRDLHNRSVVQVKTLSLELEQCDGYLSKFESLATRAHGVVDWLTTDNMIMVCSVCTNKAKWLCAHCMTRPYCSRSCQKRHWKSMHKHECKQLHEKFGRQPPRNEPTPDQ